MLYDGYVLIIRLPLFGYVTQAIAPRIGFVSRIFTRRSNVRKRFEAATQNAGFTAEFFHLEAHFLVFTNGNAIWNAKSLHERIGYWEEGAISCIALVTMANAN